VSHPLHASPSQATFGWRETSLRGKVVALRTVDSFAPHASVLDMNAPVPAARSKGKAGSGSAVESKGGSSAASATGSDAKSEAGGKDSDKKDKATGAYWVPFVQVDSVDATIGKVLKNGGSVVSAASSIPSVGRFAVVADGLGASIGVLAPHEEAAEDADFEEFAPAEVVGDWEHFDEKEFDRIAAQNAAASAGGALPGMGGGRAAGSGGSGGGGGGGASSSASASASSGYSSGGGSHSFGLGL
jgi:predicted enzyme related to lactoylglutathione lyase